ncbi:TraI domain-containing protein [Succinivibrio dextrinosolvens]|uniref:TraI domain-containing protein n=1 Tax=Succinivibrio dextrinosolvens TaxID=83771 RepID=UPI00241D86DC|nr:TraI domain-containing protein [Succinivibrio dextrinosolvens]MBE6423081.1 hypothetical protein [Succinivibrio dextrinosolvens]
MKFAFFHKSEKDTFTQPVQPQIRLKPQIFNTIESEGYYCYSPDDLIDSEQFRPLVDKISTAMGGRKELFDKYLLPSIQQVALYCQKIPASEVKGGKPSNIFGHHMSEGGLLQHSLETMYFALNDSRLAFFNKGVNPSARIAHVIAARITCGLAGLLHDIGKLNDPIIVTYKEEDGRRVEYTWNCIESIPDFLARIHEIKSTDVFVSSTNRNPPTYIIKGWKKGRNDKHEIIAPFLLRSFVSKATLKLISEASEELLHNFMTAVDWRVLASDYTNARQNIIYDIWSRADTTSSERDRKTLSKSSLSPIKTNLEIKKQITKAFQYMIDKAKISVNRDSAECYIFSHAVNQNKTPFVLLIRFDEKSLGMWLNVMSQASEFYKSDILQDHEPNLDTVKELLTLCDYLLPAKTADGMYTIERLMGSQKETFKAICIADYKNVILQNGQLYLAQEEDLQTLKLTFADGIEPNIVSKSVVPTEDLSSDLGDPKAKQKKKQDKKKQKQVQEVKLEETKAEDNNSNSQKGEVDELQLESEEDQMKAKVQQTQNSEPDLQEIFPAEAQHLASLINGQNETEDKDAEEQESDEVADSYEELDNQPFIIPVVDDNSENSQVDEMQEATPEEDVTDITAPEGFGDSVSSFTMGLFQTALSETQEKIEEQPQTVQEEPDDRPLVLKENQIRNFDRSIYNYKEKQKDLVNAQKPNAIKLKDLEADENLPKPDNRIFQSVDEPYYNGLTVSVVNAIKEIANRIKDKKTARNFSIQMCNRLLEKSWSYIDFVTVDNKYCYAAFIWNEEVVKDANAVQYIKGFEDAGLFPFRLEVLANHSQELYYFEHIQMTKAVTNIFKLAGLKPLKIKCKDHPFESLNDNVSALDIVEYVKHKIITLDKNEELYGYKPLGFAHERKGRRIDKSVLRKCCENYAISYSNTKDYLCINQQITPPYMIVDGENLVVGYQRKLTEKELTEEEKQNESLRTDKLNKKGTKKPKETNAKESQAMTIDEMPLFPAGF